MRALKYRAWDNQQKIMRPDYEYDSLYLNIFSGAVINNSSGDWSDEEDAADVVLMQYVGMADKHGRDVYEGDFVRAVLCENPGEKAEEVVEEVIIHQGHLAPFYMRVNFEEDWWKDSLQDGFEVIGNRYENPELVKL